MDDIFWGDDFVTHSLTHSLTPLLVRFVTAGLAVRAPFASTPIPVKTWQTSAKYPSAGNANHGIF